MAKKQVKRRADHPYIPPLKPKSTAPSLRSIQRQNADIRRARVKAIVERTAAGRAELDKRMAGADVSDLAEYPVVFYPYGPPKPVGLKGKFDDSDHDARKPPGPGHCGTCGKIGHTRQRCPTEAIEQVSAPVIEALERIAATPQIAPAVPLRRRNYRCNHCGKAGHNTRSCPDLADSLERITWLHIDRVLSDCNGNITIAARRLGVFRQTLQRKLKTRKPRRAPTARSPVETSATL